MKFGFTVPPVGPAGASDAENYARVLRDCRLGHELGYDAAWALGVRHVVAGHFLYEMDDALRRRPLRLFAERVIPHFREGAAA